jgi:RNA polymerase sigma-70 factor (ECF subfamily)
MARVGDPDAAEEIAQDVFAAAVTGIGRLRERSDPVVEAWFVGIARIKVLDRSRRSARRARVIVPLDRHEDPEEVATARLAAAELRSALGSLTPDQRDVLVRRFILDQSLEQVATATGRRVNAVKALQHRAVGAMGRLLGSDQAVRAAA